MSKQKSKITLELPRAKNLSFSVFQRLGKGKPPKSVPELTKKAVEASTSKPVDPVADSVSAKLQLVRQKAAEIMDSKKKLDPRPQLTVIKTVRPVRRSSSSESSSSSSATSSSSSSPRRKKKRAIRKRAPSSSSDERKVVKNFKHKKAEKRSHHKKAKELTKTLVKRAISPYSRRRESESPPKKLVKVRKEKVYRHPSRELIDRDREIYEREKLKARERERLRSPTPKQIRRSSPPRLAVYKERSSERSPYRRAERERKEQRDYEILRERERAEALARCQERQRERERIKKMEEIERARVVERRPRSVERRPIPRSSRERSRSFSR